MAITPITPNIDNTKSHKPYREANYLVKTDNNVKPYKPEGHLVHDRLLMMPKFFLKDMAYDFKAVKDGFQGKANDHQTGRLNDVGLKLGGISIATILAARTSNPVLRTMEYAGLGAFLASMALFPKVAIQAPSRIKHGFDTGIEYIDDQGRKKSMFQDPNYIPFDMYQGERKGEDLDVIGDRLGIPRDIQNRHDVIKEQMRKIGIQNNTLWMLTAGFATPVIAALLCNGLERVIAPAIEKARNMNYNSKISHALKTTEAMNLNVNEIENNNLSKQVEKILAGYKDKQLPKSELERISDLMTKNLDSFASQGIKEDLANILNGETKSFVLDEKGAEEIISSIKKSLPQNNKQVLEKVFVPTTQELENILGSNKEITADGIKDIKGKLRTLFAGKMAAESGVSKEFLEAYQNRILEDVSKTIQTKPSNLVSEGTINDITNFAKVIGEFKSNDKVLDKCKSFKFEHAQETVLARAYGKFEKTLLNVLDIKFSDLKKMRHSEKYAQEITQKKLEALAKDDAKFEKAVGKLAKVMSEMEIALNGKEAEGSYVKDLISAIENNYNNTAKRLDNLGKGKFKNTITMLVNEDVKTLSNSLTSRQDVYDFLDGILKPKEGLEGAALIKENSKGVGSSKNLQISRIAERYQGANNSFRRVLHAFDIAKRPVPKDGYGKKLFETGRDAVFNATSADHTMKLNTVNNPEFYKDVMRTTWKDGVEDATKKGLENGKDGDIPGRFNKYITRFRDIMGNNDIDFTKPEHILDKNNLNKYRKSDKTRMAKFNLVAQSPADMLKQAAERRYGTQKWMRIVSVIGGVTLGVTVLAQFFFGKLKNPHNLRKQVSHDTNN